MQSPERYLETITNDDEYDLAEPKSPEEPIDRFGMRASLLMLCVGLFIAAAWMISRPSFEKCLVLEDIQDRHACFDKLRANLLRLPGKGAKQPLLPYIRSIDDTAVVSSARPFAGIATRCSSRPRCLVTTYTTMMYCGLQKPVCGGWIRPTLISTSCTVQTRTSRSKRQCAQWKP